MKPAQVTEAHKALWTKLYNLAYHEIFEDFDDSSDGPATQLIADSEARAVENALHVKSEWALSVLNERDKLREWQAGVIANERTHHAARKEALARAERAEAELAKERARLDWLEFRGPWEAWSEPCNDAEITLRGPIRAAIDAAMKEAAP